MKKRLFWRLGIPALVLLLSAGLAWSQTVQIKTSANGVNYLTDDKGMTLYYYTLDTNGQSACYGPCATAWPLFDPDTISVGDGLNASDFTYVTRTDGTKQAAYDGWPLYYWVNDKQPGDMTGEDVHHVWYIMEPSYSVMIGTNKAVGNYLVDGKGDTLYWFTKDSMDQSACTGGCLKAWPAFDPKTLAAPSVLNPADFGTITRSDGGEQETYKGYPLYYWQNDKNRGDVTGEGVGKVWYVIDPANFPPSKM